MSFDENEIAIKVEHVKKIYKIFNTPGQRFIYHMFHLNNGQDFIALDDISFEVRKGESFGIIGRNGSGKSTMLQLLAGILKVTSGKITVNGKVAALLELGSGFNPESTGYENIYMNAAILGVSKTEIDAKVDEIVGFADIGDFISQPVKTYSSGMFVRLAFAVAINVDADILLIDEALAVGDVFFRQKCYKKLEQLKEEGKTIILVSHGMNEVEQFCDRVLLLSQSKMVMCGDSREAVQRYYVSAQNSVKVKRESYDLSRYEKKQFDSWRKKENSIFNCNIDQSNIVSGGKVEFLNVGVFDEDGNDCTIFHQGEYGYFLYEIKVLEDIETPIAGIVFYDQRNTIVFGKDNMQTYLVVPHEVAKGDIVRVLFKIKMDVAVGEYTFDAGFNHMSNHEFERRMYKSQSEINEVLERLCALSKVGSFQVHDRIKGDPMKIMFHGCCDLPTEVELLFSNQF